MARGVTTAIACSMALALGTAAAWGQPKSPCDAEGRVVTPRKVEGQVVKVDPTRGRVSVREATGAVHEFQASAETLKELKAGDRIEATLREAPKCP